MSCSPAHWPPPTTASSRSSSGPSSSFARSTTPSFPIRWPFACTALGTTSVPPCSARQSSLLPACLCYLCWQAQETLRRFVLADFRYSAAVPGDAVAYVGQGLLVTVLLY